MDILVLDNYDSFTYNLVHAIKKQTTHSVAVYRNDEISLAGVKKYDKVLLSPGPGIPDEACILKPLIETYAGSKSILGICLGQQAIAAVFGGRLVRAQHMFHGLATPTRITDREEPLFQGLPETIETARYHSWVVVRDGLPQALQITAESEAGEIMALRHREYDVRGVQFHPESILTPKGDQIIKNWLRV
ncbi:MAG: aminodeoxychorismate/anthranilate synthase component II [Flavobacteriales bacterium]